MKMKSALFFPVIQTRTVRSFSFCPNFQQCCMTRLIPLFRCALRLKYASVYGKPELKVALLNYEVSTSASQMRSKLSLEKLYDSVMSRLPPYLLFLFISSIELQFSTTFKLTP